MHGAIQPLASYKSSAYLQFSPFIVKDTENYASLKITPGLSPLPRGHTFHLLLPLLSLGGGGHFVYGFSELKGEGASSGSGVKRVEAERRGSRF